MNQKTKNDWIKALRSGNYKQGQGYLRYNDNYCCLGVLCEVLGKEWTPEPYVGPDDDPIYSIDGEYQCLPDKIKSLFNQDGNTATGIENNLIELNDGCLNADIYAHTFSEIADWIEENIVAHEDIPKCSDLITT